MWTAFFEVPASYFLYSTRGAKLWESREYITAILQYPLQLPPGSTPSPLHTMTISLLTRHHTSKVECRMLFIAEQQWVLFPLDPQRWTLRLRWNKTHYFPVGPVISVLLCLPTQKYAKNYSFACSRVAQQISVVSRSTTWSRARRKFKLLFP